MSKKLQAIVLAMGLSVILFGVGCSSDDDNNEPTPPTLAERMLGLWDAADPTLLTNDIDGRVEMDILSGGEFALKLVFPSGPLDDDSVTYTGNWTTQDNMYMVLSNVEVDGVPNEPASMMWPVSISANNDSLTITHTDIVETPVQVLYINVSPSN